MAIRKKDVQELLSSRFNVSGPVLQDMTDYVMLHIDDFLVNQLRFRQQKAKQLQDIIRDYQQNPQAIRGIVGKPGVTKEDVQDLIKRRFNLIAPPQSMTRYVMQNARDLLTMSNTNQLCFRVQKVKQFQDKFVDYLPKKTQSEAPGSTLAHYASQQQMRDKRQSLSNELVDKILSFEKERIEHPQKQLQYDLHTAANSIGPDGFARVMIKISDAYRLGRRPHRWFGERPLPIGLDTVLRVLSASPVPLTSRKLRRKFIADTICDDILWSYDSRKKNNPDDFLGRLLKIYQYPNYKDFQKTVKDLVLFQLWLSNYEKTDVQALSDNIARDIIQKTGITRNELERTFNDEPIPSALLDAWFQEA